MGGRGTNKPPLFHLKWPGQGLSGDPVRCASCPAPWSPRCAKGGAWIPPGPPAPSSSSAPGKNSRHLLIDLAVEINVKTRDIENAEVEAHSDKISKYVCALSYYTFQTEHGLNVHKGHKHIDVQKTPEKDPGRYLATPFNHTEICREEPRSVAFISLKMAWKNIEQQLKLNCEYINSFTVVQELGS